MNSKIKTWTGLGLATALAGTALVSCSSDEDIAEVEDTEIADGALADGESGDGENGEGEGGEASQDMETLPLPHRLAFMAGHVETGLALYRAGEAEAAAPHLLHPVSETHADERAGIDELGFEGDLFEAVSTALEQGLPAADIEPQLSAAEANLRAVREAAGGDTAGIINFLMDTIVDEYNVALTDGVVTDPGEYQDAYGFAIVASQLAGDLDEDSAQAVGELLTTLIALWPTEAPVPPEDPAPTGQVSALTSSVKLALPSE